MGWFIAHAAPLWRVSSLAAALALAVLVAGIPGAPAQEVGVQVVRVEEDWELVVAEPDLELNAPQVTAVLSPVGHLDGLYAAFELNHQSQPYAGGGLHLQLWNGEAPVLSKRHKEGEVLQHANEVVRWTQSMRLADGVLTFEITNGTSTSWGAFGGPLTAGVATTLTNLNGYNPLVSVQESGAGYAANRISSLVLKKVRVHTSDGQVVEDTTAKVAYPKSL